MLWREGDVDKVRACWEVKEDRKVIDWTTCTAEESYCTGAEWMPENSWTRENIRGKKGKRFLASRNVYGARMWLNGMENMSKIDIFEALSLNPNISGLPASTTNQTHARYSPSSSVTASPWALNSEVHTNMLSISHTCTIPTTRLRWPNWDQGRN